MKSDGQKLGLDVDYMAERKVLPIMHVTGGVAEEWNRRNPVKKMKSSLEKNTEGKESCMIVAAWFIHIKLPCFFCLGGDEIILVSM